VKAVLRSLLHRDPIEKPPTKVNLGRTKAERLLNLTTPEKNVLDYVLDHYTTHAEAPHYQLVYEHFELRAPTRGRDRTTGRPSPRGHLQGGHEDRHAGHN
jgi:hypothetical protein